jgi:hypothetical protein
MIPAFERTKTVHALDRAAGHWDRLSCQYQTLKYHHYNHRDGRSSDNSLDGKLSVVLAGAPTNLNEINVVRTFTGLNWLKIMFGDKICVSVVDSRLVYVIFLDYGHRNFV